MMADQRNSEDESRAAHGGAGGPLVEAGTPLSAETAAAAERAAQLETPALLADILKAAADRSGKPAGAAVEEFLEGKGDLLDLVRSSLTGRKTAAKKKIAAFLVEKFKLTEEVALTLASLLIKAVPAAGKLAEQTEKEEKKTVRRKKSAKTAGKTSKAKAKKTAAKKKRTTAKTGEKKAGKTKTAAKAKKPAARKKKSA